MRARSQSGAAYVCSLPRSDTKRFLSSSPRERFIFVCFLCKENTLYFQKEAIVYKRIPGTISPAVFFFLFYFTTKETLKGKKYCLVSERWIYAEGCGMRQSAVIGITVQRADGYEKTNEVGNGTEL